MSQSKSAANDAVLMGLIVGLSPPLIKFSERVDVQEGSNSRSICEVPQDDRRWKNTGMLLCDGAVVF